MRGVVSHIELKQPATLAEALQILQNEPDIRPLAGGTDLMVELEAGLLKGERFLSLWKLDSLRRYRFDDSALHLGSLVTYAELQRDQSIQHEFPNLCQAARETGGAAIQSRGTIGGNIANASPAADSPPALLAYGAALELISAAGARTVDYATFHNGYKAIDLQRGELIAAITLPRATHARRVHDYRKVGTRKAQAISKVVFAGVADLDREGRIAEARFALGSVAPIVVTCRNAAQLLIGKQGKQLSEVIPDVLVEVELAISPIDDIRSTSVYRRQVALNLVEEFCYKLVRETSREAPL